MARQVPAPTGGAALDLLERVDYADAFAASTSARRRPGEWARLALDSAPPLLGRFVRLAHRVLGLRLAPSGSSAHLWGWDVLRDGLDAFVLGVEGALVTPRIVVTAPPGQVVAATLIRFDHPVAPLLWAGVAPIHRAVARRLVDGAVAGTSCRGSSPHSGEAP